MLVSHDAGTIEQVCERVIVLDHGKVAFDGPTDDAIRAYRRLLAGEPPDGAAATRPEEAT